MRLGRLGISLRLFPLAWIVLFSVISTVSFGQDTLPLTQSNETGKSNPIDITAERVEFDRRTETYEAHGSVVIVQGFLRLTSDQAILNKLTGRLRAMGHVHLQDQVSDVWSERLEINVNTESGVITQGRVFLKETRTWIRGRLLQRYSESHFRAQDGSFTNCDADEGQIPDWEFTFADVDLEQRESISARGVWFRIRNKPIIPIPAIRYPMPGARKAGLLVPIAGYDNVFGFVYRQGYYWPFSPSQDLTISPQVLSDRGGGVALGYRYILSRQAKGNWQVNSLWDTDVDRYRAQFTGVHAQQVNPSLSVRAEVNYATDSSLLADLSNSGIFRALPSQQSILTVNQLLDHGSLFLTAQYLQPLENGGQTTFQRLPEIGHRFRSQPFFGRTVLVGMNSTFVHFARDEGFNVSRVDLLPGVSTQGLHLGHIVGLTPQAKVRGVFYSHGRQATQDDAENRETFWVALEASSSLSRRFQLNGGRRLRHTIEPNVIYEYVPPTSSTDIVQIDAVDELPKKNLLTYTLRTALKEESPGSSRTWVDLGFGQSYHLGSSPDQASIFSDLFGTAMVNLPMPDLASITGLSLSVDSFFDAGDREFSQFNTDARVQGGKLWYLNLGHRYRRSGTVPRRGDIWNPRSWNEVFVDQSEIDFLTASGAIRTPLGWTVGSRVYHDFTIGQTPEWDVVALYQNPCKCWSLGLFYIRLAETDTEEERNQFNFVVTLRGVGTTPGLGAQIMQTILSPILGNEPGLPWSVQ